MKDENPLYKLTSRGLLTPGVIGVRGCSVEQFEEHLEDGILPFTFGDLGTGWYFFPFYENLPHSMSFHDQRIAEENPSSTQVDENKSLYAAPGAFMAHCANRDILLTEGEFLDVHYWRSKGTPFTEIVDGEYFDKTRKIAGLTNLEMMNILEAGFSRKGMQFTLSDKVLSDTRFGCNYDNPHNGVVYPMNETIKGIPLEYVAGVQAYTLEEKADWAEAFRQAA
jgi:hypothetical protein